MTTGVEYQLNKLPFFENPKQVFFHDRESDVHFSSFTKDNQFGCVAGNTVAGIKSNGLVMACGFLPHQYSETTKNSAVHNRFIDLWNESENISFMRKLSPNASCASCSFLPVCGGGCRANAMLAHGDIAAIDPYCFKAETSANSDATPSLRYFANVENQQEPWLSSRTITTKCGSGSLL